MFCFSIFTIAYFFFNKSFRESKHLQKDLHLTNNINLDNSQNGVLIKSEYILGAGDLLNIEFKGLEIFSADYPIDPEGEINLPELNKIKANNLTLRELTKKLENLYKEFIKNPEIEITITNYRPVTFIYLEKSRIQAFIH